MPAGKRECGECGGEGTLPSHAQECPRYLDDPRKPCTCVPVDEPCGECEAGLVDCRECEGVGEVTLSGRAPWDDRQVACPECVGEPGPPEWDE